MELLIDRAQNLGAVDMGLSWRKNKKYYVRYDDKYIHFGSPNGKTFLNHHNYEKLNNWILRHSKIKNANGEYVMHLSSSPSYWSHQLLWIPYV